jgi:hypothetical protein
MSEEANKKQPAVPVESPTLRAAMGVIPNPHSHPQDVPLPEAVNQQTNRDPYSCWGLDAKKNPEPALALLGEAPATAPAVGLPGAAGEGPGKVTVTCNEAGDCVAVTRTDDEGRILSVLWERDERHEISTQTAPTHEQVMEALQSFRTSRWVADTDGDPLGLYDMLPEGCNPAEVIEELATHLWEELPGDSRPQRGDKSELAHALRVLHGSKKPHAIPGGTGQQLGNESYRIIASGSQLEALMDAADALERHRLYPSSRLVDALDALADPEGNLPIPPGPEADELHAAYAEHCERRGQETHHAGDYAACPKCGARVWSIGNPCPARCVDQTNTQL